jgi:hypothetical protein
MKIVDVSSLLALHYTMEELFIYIHPIVPPGFRAEIRTGSACGFTIKKVTNFPLPCSRDVNNQTFPGRGVIKFFPGQGEFG